MAVKKPVQYNITPAKGQALLNFQGRRFPDKVELFETNIIEQVRQKEKEPKLKLDKQTELNADFTNLLIHGDCLSACACLKSKNIKVDLVYIDPPFASGANYAKKIYLRNGEKTEFENEDNSIGEEIMYGDIWQKEDYLNWLYERLLAIREVMNETASIYVHLDWHIGHYVKILLDEVFGEENFLNNVVWCYKTRQFSKRYWNRKHDDLLVYSKNIDQHLFNWDVDGVIEPYSEETIKKFKLKDEKGYYRLCGRGINGSPIKGAKDVDPKWEITNPELVVRDYIDKGYAPNDYWIMDIVNQAANEREEFITQKPEHLLSKIIKASSLNDLIIADFFSGSGTTAKVANDLGRKFIACDIGVNSVQTTRDRLIEAGAEFDILKVNDGVRLFRNPAQTQQKIFSLVDGFKSRTDLGLGDFWDGGLAAATGSYVPVKIVGIHERLTKQLLDYFLEEIYQLEPEGNVNAVKIIYAHKDLEIDQQYIDKELKESKRTTIKVELISLDTLLGSKRDLLFPPDSADVKVTKEKNKYKVTINKYFSSYLKTKIDEFNAKKVKKAQIELLEKEELQSHRKIKLSKTGLELIESVQFDTTLRKDGVWESNLDYEDKAGIKEKIKGVYYLPTNKFKIKIRNIAGDELIIENS